MSRTSENARRLTGHLNDDTSREEFTATTQHLMNQHNWTKEATKTLQNMPINNNTLQQWREQMGIQIQETITKLEHIRKEQQKEPRLKGQEAYIAKLSTQA
jgi:hypothetical protein